MAHGFKTGGRKKGTPNKRTVEREQALEKAKEEIAATLGQSELKWDAHSLLVAIYSNETLPLEMRMDAAKHAVRYEKPAKSETTVTDNTRWLVSDGTVSMDEWKRKYAPTEKQDEDTTH